MNRDGFALMFVLLVVAALELLALSTVSLATHESVAVHAEQRTVIARRAAEAALRRFARNWPHANVGQLPVRGTITVADGSGVQLTVERHAWGLYEIIAAAPAGSSFIRMAMVLRTLDFPRAMQEAARAMMSAGMPTDSLACTLPAWPSPPSAAPLPGGYALGGVRWDEAASIADSVVSGSVTLAATDTTGAPVVRLLYSRGDLAIVAGQGSGILLVDGNLDMHAGAEFNGIVVVRGTAGLAAGARVYGSLWVQRAGASPPASGQLLYSPCWCARALLGAPGAQRLISAQRRFIPAF